MESENQLNPLGPILSILLELDSDVVQAIANKAGLTPDWSLNQSQNYSHKTRCRAYRSRISNTFNELDDNNQQVALLRIAELITEHDEVKAEDLNEALDKIGWRVVDNTLVPTNLIAPFDWETLPENAKNDFSKIGPRLLSGDLSGVVSAASGALESVVSGLAQDHKVEGVEDADSLQKKVKLLMNKTRYYDELRSRLRELEWQDNEINLFVNNHEGATNQMLTAFQKLRSNMGDVHGTKPVIRHLVTQAVKIAGLLCFVVEADGLSK